MRFALHHWWLIFPAWLAAACIAGPLIGRWLRRNRSRPLPQRIPLGDYVPDDWIAEYEKKNRGRP